MNLEHVNKRLVDNESQYIIYNCGLTVRTELGEIHELTVMDLKDFIISLRSTFNIQEDGQIFYKNNVPMEYLKSNFHGRIMCIV
jgi:hypothetical protein